METLVLKCKEAVNNSNLRGMNELRIGVKNNTTDPEAAQESFRFVLNTGTITTNVKYKVISGDVHFKVGRHTDDKPNVTEADTTEYVYVYCPSGSGVISIQNFDLVANKIGISNYAANNTPTPVILVEELKEKEFLTDILHGSCFYEGDMSKMGNLPLVTNFGANNSGYDINFRFSLGDLKKVPSANVDCVRCLFSGGDVYDLFCNRAYCNVAASQTNRNTIPHTPPTVTCRYSQGDNIPVFTFKKFRVVGSSKNENSFATLGDLKAVMQLLIDGIGGNITLDGAASLSFDATIEWWNEISELRSTLESKGVTVSRS